MIRTFYASVRMPLVAPLAALIFSGCSGAELPEPSGTDPVPSNTAPAETTPASSNANSAASSNPSTYSYNTSPSDSEQAPSDNEASDTDAADAMAESHPVTGTELVQQGAPAISLGAGEGFALLAGATITCTNSSAVIGDVGVSPGIAITGFDASCTLSGAIHAQDAAASAAHADLLIAFDALRATECETDLTGVELGGLTLAPGVYCFDTTAGVTGGLTLDADGDANASWIFKVGSAITTAPGSTMVMAGSGDACNVFWQVGTSATLGTTSSFTGNILASASISLTSGSSLEGRALALVGAVTSDDNVVSNCGR